MIQPNSACAGFCYWMLFVSKQHLSGPQRVLVTAVYTAAVNVTSITSQDWYNFNLFSAWRNKYYIVYRDYTVQSGSTLWLGITGVYDFEGTANNFLGTNNGLATDVLYSQAYGRIDQGASFNGLTSKITFPYFQFSGDFAINIWLKPINNGLGYLSVWSDSGTNDNVSIFNATGDVIFNNNGVSTSLYPVNYGVWNMLTFNVTNNVLDYYFNGTPAAMAVPVNRPFATDVLGSLLSAVFYQGNMDIFNYWFRSLSPIEVSLLYNAGGGLQYPFTN